MLALGIVGNFVAAMGNGHRLSDRFQQTAGCFEAMGGACHCAGDIFPVDIKEGYTLRLAPTAGGAYPQGAPSLLGGTYMASHGGARVVVGASKGPGKQLSTAPQVHPQLWIAQHMYSERKEAIGCTRENDECLEP